MTNHLFWRSGSRTLSHGKGYDRGNDDRSRVSVLLLFEVPLSPRYTTFLDRETYTPVGTWTLRVELNNIVFFYLKVTKSDDLILTQKKFTVLNWMCFWDKMNKPREYYSKFYSVKTGIPTPLTSTRDLINELFDCSSISFYVI